MKAIITTVLCMILVVGFGVKELRAEEEKSLEYSLSSGVEDQTSVAVTIYNVNLGLIKDKRSVQLKTGTGELRFMDVASQIIPSSVYITSLGNSESFTVLEQNYEYDLLNPQKLLDKYVGKEIKLYQKNPYTEREEIVRARLLSNNGGPIYQIGDEITYGHPGRVIFPGIPGTLIAQPTLVWLLQNKLPSGQDIEVSYLTNGITWKADYILILNEKDDHGDISGWVTIDNKSGAVYRNAQLKLIAGDVHRVRDQFAYREKMLQAAERSAQAEPQFREEGFFEYHIYTLQRPSTIKENQTKQISLLKADNIPLKKELIFYGSRYYYRGQYGEITTNQKVGVFVELENRIENNLGIPLPQGIVRVYKEDQEKSLQFVGEDLIDHTPKDEKMRIRLGEAFDVVGTRKQTEWKKIASDSYEATYEVTLCNHKETDATVRIIEPIPGDWQMVSASYDYTKTDSHAAEFVITVPKNKEVKLSYRVRMRF